jgi:hypothetical protein
MLARQALCLLSPCINGVCTHASPLRSRRPWRALSTARLALQKRKRQAQAAVLCA